MFGKIFRKRQKLGEATGRLDDHTLSEGAPILSQPPGAFSMYVQEDAMGLLLEHGDLTRKEVIALPQIVYDACKSLGFLRRDPVHFDLCARNLRKPTDRAKQSPALFRRSSRRMGIGFRGV